MYYVHAAIVPNEHASPKSVSSSYPVWESQPPRCLHSCEFNFWVQMSHPLTKECLRYGASLVWGEEILCLKDRYHCLDILNCDPASTTCVFTSSAFGKLIRHLDINLVSTSSRKIFKQPYSPTAIVIHVVFFSAQSFHFLKIRCTQDHWQEVDWGRSCREPRLR